METKHIYKKMTNVDIDEQRLLWDDRGKGYYGEYLLFCELYKLIEGNCKLLMNLNIPVGNGKTTEIDLLMIHETGFYVFEAKHYKGTIYGDDKGEIWTQYFRTVKNSVFRNPMLQNEYHLRALKKLFPSVPVKSIIVFTNDDCDIRVDNSNVNISLCNLNNLIMNVTNSFESSTKRYTMEEIDKMFLELSKYSQMQEEILFDGEEKSFIDWLEPTINMLKEKKEEVEVEKQKVIDEQKSLKKTKISFVVITIIVGIICVLFSSYCVGVIKEDYNTELSKFKQNFLHVDEIDNEYIQNVNEYVEVSNVSLIDFSNNSTSFQATLTIDNEYYGISINEDSKYIVMDNNGKVYEYDVFGEHLNYNYSANLLGKGIRTSGTLASAQFFGIVKDDITYIKLTNITLFKLDINKTLVKEELELELYKK